MSITNLSVEATDLLARLRANIESEELRADGSRWGDGYLPNARPHTMSGHQFAGYLSALEAAGLYEKMADADGFFGLVKF